MTDWCSVMSCALRMIRLFATWDISEYLYVKISQSLPHVLSPCRLAQDEGATVCVCDSSLGLSADTATLTLYRNPAFVSVHQSGTFYPISAFEELLQNIFFTYDLTRPLDLEGYHAVVKATVNDGDLSSEPAFTTIQVNVMNEGPRVLLDGQVGTKVCQCQNICLWYI